MKQYSMSELMRGFELFGLSAPLRDRSVHVVRLKDLKTGKVFLHMDWPPIDDEEFEDYSVEITPEGREAYTVVTNVPKYNFYPEDPDTAFDIEVSAYGAGGAKRYFVLNVHLDRAKQSQETKQTEEEHGGRTMKLTFREIHEGQQIPWWGRIWRWDLARDTGWVMPIPFCWLARIVWNLWCASFRLRPNALEALVASARQDGYAGGYQRGLERGKEESNRKVEDWIRALNVRLDQLEDTGLIPKAKEEP